MLATLQQINQTAAFNRWAGFEVLRASDGQVELAMPWRDELGQYAGFLHAGVSAALLDDLAKETGELVRLAVSDGTRLVWVAKAQGARTGLRLDADSGAEAYLPASATGLAWLAAMTDEKALQWVAAQGMEQAKQHGPGAPRTIVELLERTQQTRERGYAMVVDAYEPGTSAIAALVCQGQGGEPVGTVSVAGPSARMTPARMEAMGPLLLACARALDLAGVAAR